MCGLVGIYEYGVAEGSVNRRDVDRMRDVLAHRGPDGADTFITDDRKVGLGHRRLAIVDLEHGQQPMRTPSGTVLVANGEIYNYAELRRELKDSPFATRCDVEVILHAYERWGVQGLARLVGMFAFALWDPRRRSMLLCRDPVGEKPMYWSDCGGRLIFGSEPKAVLAHHSVARRVNEPVVSTYLTHLTIPAPATLYRDINKLAPGSYLLRGPDGATTVRRYADVLAPRTWTQVPYREAVSTVKDLLAQSIDARLMSDVPVGILLSGGLDSTTLAAHVTSRGSSLATFSVGFDNESIDERSEARAVARELGLSDSHFEVVVNEQDAVSSLAAFVEGQDEPLADPVSMPLFHVCRLARENGVKVVLAGEGSDEIFWGYPAYARGVKAVRAATHLSRAPRVARTLARVAPKNRKTHVRDALLGAAAGRFPPMHVPGLTADRANAVLRGPHARGGYQLSNQDVEPLLTALAFDTQQYEFEVRLPELLLMRIDRFSMANGVEARVPFLDPALVRYSLHLPVEYRLSAAVGKRVLRDAVEDIVPEWVINRKKVGFGAPVGSWLAASLGDMIPALLSGPGGAYFDTEEVLRLLSQHRANRNLGFVLWPIFNFLLWHRRWIESESLENVA